MDIDYVKKNIYIYFPIIYTFLNLLITFVRFMSRNFENKVFKNLFFEFSKQKSLQNIMDFISFMVGIYAITGFFINV